MEFVMLINKQKVINSPFPSRLVCLGPASNSVGRKNYYVSFIDDYSKFA
jgi:hypothetical protein